MKSSKYSRQRVSKKIKHLIDEGKSPDQAIAMALSMEREGRISDSGSYIPVSRKVKKASAEKDADNDKHVVHFIMNGNGLDYVEEYHFDNSDKITLEAANILNNYIKYAASSPLVGKKNNYIIINNKESGIIVHNVFLFRGFSSEEFQEIKNIITL